MTADIDNPDIGTHLKIKFLANSFLLHSIELMKEFLYETVHNIGAKPLREPIIDNVVLRLKELGEEPYADEGGISGLITLSVSHISCHTWPKHNGTSIINEDGGAVLDIYSCRPFKKELALDVLNRIYKPSKVQCKDVSDTLKWDE